MQENSNFPKSKILWMIEETFAMKQGTAIQNRGAIPLKESRSKVSEIYYHRHSITHLCYKLSYEQIFDKIQSSRDIFQQPFNFNDQNAYVDMMRHLIVGIAEMFLLNEFELLLLFHIIDQDFFDILNIRNISGISDLRLEDMF